MKKSMLKKILSLVLVVAMLGCFTGCSDDKETSGGSGDEKVYKIGISQYVQHDALDAATEGFQDALKDKLGDKVEFELKNASDDPAVSATIANQFVIDEVDLIMANATPSLQAAMQATADIPIVATSVTDFATALDTTDWTGKTGINVTGTADLAPLAEQAAMVKELLPDAKTVGILYCSSEANSKYQADVIKTEFDKLGLTSKEYTVADTNDIASVVTQICDEVDCIYIPTDNKIASATAAVHEIAYPKQIPIIAGEEGICKGCGIATLSISYYSIGYEAGLMAYEILVNDADPAEMEIKYATELTKKYVEERTTTLNITVPEDYVAIDMSAE
ncbi:MAG: ABC transporter substrate-binding protein [Tyzzerella sp.]|nr:ABC transporter substrate-binding protein [Tyzzerella sp.]